MTAAPPTTAIADVLALRGRTGWLSPPLRRVVPGAAAGAACTVSLRPGPGGFGPLYELLSRDLRGRAIVVTAPGDDAAVWGALLGTAAAGAGATAVLLAGAVRDVDGCAGVGVPTWARATATVGPGGALEVAAVGKPVMVGGVEIVDGDRIVVDGDGVVALPAAGADAVLADAAAYGEAEDRVADALAAGTRLVEAYKHKADVVARLRSTNW